jgi:hypothetical protein
MALKREGGLAYDDKTKKVDITLIDEWSEDLS